MVDAKKVVGAVKLWTPVIIASATALDKVWKTLNANHRVTASSTRLFSKVGGAAGRRDPLDRLAGQLDALDTYLADVDADPVQVESWRVRASRARRLVGLARAMPPEQKKSMLTTVDFEVAALFSDVIIAAGILGAGEPVASRAEEGVPRAESPGPTPAQT